METKDAALLGFVSAAEKFVNNHLTDGTDLGELKDINISKLKNELSDELKSLGLTEKYKKELNGVGEKAFADYAEEHFGIKKSNVLEELGEIFNFDKEEKIETNEKEYDEDNIEESLEDTSKKINALLDAYDFSVDTLEDEKIEDEITKEETAEDVETIAKPSEDLGEIFNEVLENENEAQEQEVDEFGLTKDDDVFLQIANAAAKSDEELAKAFDEEPAQESVAIDNNQQENQNKEETQQEDVFSDDTNLEEEIHEETIDTNDILEEQPIIEESITNSNNDKVVEETIAKENVNEENNFEQANELSSKEVTDEKENSEDVIDEPIEAMEIIDTFNPVVQEETLEEKVDETINNEENNTVIIDDLKEDNIVLEDNQKEEENTVIDNNVEKEKTHNFNDETIKQEEIISKEVVKNVSENNVENEKVEEIQKNEENIVVNEMVNDNVQAEEIKEFYDVNAEETNVDKKIEYDSSRVPLSVELRRLKGEEIVEIPDEEPVQEENKDKKEDDVITPVSIFNLNPFGSEGGTYVPPSEDAANEPVKTEIPANFGYIVNPVLDIVLEQEKEANENFYSNDIYQEEENKEEERLKAKKYIEKLVANPGFTEPQEKSKTLSSIIAGLDNLRKRQEDKKVLEEEYKQNEEIYEDIMSAYPYLEKSFIKAVYSQKEDIENEYVEDGSYILLHRLIFSDLDELHEFVEIMMAHDYAVNVDEKQMIVDTFREIINEDGIIIANILGIANQAMILNGKYDGYCVLDRDRILYS